MFARLLMVCGLSAVWVAAQAQVLVDVVRLSDSDAIILGHGELPLAQPVTNDHLLVLDNPFGSAPWPTDENSALRSSWMSVGRNPVSVAFETGDALRMLGHSSPTFVLGAGDADGHALSLEPGAPMAGGLLVHIPGRATWAQLGATGLVYWGAGFHVSDGSDLEVVAGMWRVVDASAVAEPASAASMLVGLVLICGLRCAKRALA